MRWVIIIAGFIGSLAALVVSGLLNFRGSYIQFAGQDELGIGVSDAMVVGIGSVGFDLLGALCGALVIAAIYPARKMGLWARLGLGVFALLGVVVCSAFSMWAASSFFSVKRADVVADRGSVVDQRSDLQSAKEKLVQRQNWLAMTTGTKGVYTPPRLVEEVQANIDQHKQHRRWGATAGCTNATVTPSIEYCREFHGLKAELARAKEFASLGEQIEAKQAALKELPAVTQADPHNATLAGLFGVAVAAMGLAVQALLPIALEFAKLFGFGLTYTYMRVSRPDVEQNKAFVAAENGRHEPVIIPLQKTASAATTGLPAAFFRERTASKSDGRLQAQECGDAYEEWCAQENMLAVPPQRFRKLAKRHVPRALSSGGRVYYGGIELVERMGEGGTQKDVA